MAEQIPPGLSDEIAALVVGIPTVSKAWLLGSRIRGDARNDSDLDIAFEMAGHDAGECLAAYICDVSGHPGWADLERRYGVRMGVTPADDVAEGVAREGRIVFERAG